MCGEAKKVERQKNTDSTFAVSLLLSCKAVLVFFVIIVIFVCLLDCFGGC